MGGLRPSARATSRLIGELTHIYAYHCPQYMRPKLQLSILINKKVGPSAPLKSHFVVRGGGRGGESNPHKCVSLYSILYEQ